MNKDLHELARLGDVLTNTLFALTQAGARDAIPYYNQGMTTIKIRGYLCHTCRRWTPGANECGHCPTPMPREDVK